LVLAEGSGGNVERYRLLETLRHFGRERALAGGEAEGLHARHAGYYRALAEEAAGALAGGAVAAWTDRLEAESMNLRQALRWAIEAGAAQEGLRLAGALSPYWHMFGYMAEGVHWLAELLALPGAAARTTARAQALAALAYLRRSARFLVGMQAAGADARAQPPKPSPSRARRAPRGSSPAPYGSWAAGLGGRTMPRGAPCWRRAWRSVASWTFRGTWASCSTG
jgi:hypothetical protein